MTANRSSCRSHGGVFAGRSRPKQELTFTVTTYKFPMPRIIYAKSKAQARWRDYSAAHEAGYYSSGFAQYLADDPQVKLVAA